MTGTPRLRCAIYTRKSTEDGLEQDFNSLDAQREACEAFIVSQAGLGWRLLHEAYDDGGISGGTMDRPALSRLLDDIKANRVDVIVVYKIDRLTRSLMDFARMVEIFDRNSVSFVSVTQQFNTTTSMGRLTLNVLLSFAQFEREVTAERIRDKIAASKKKGMWMGGTVPLGYVARDKKLVVDPETARTVRTIFSRYLELKSVRLLAEELQRAHTVSDLGAKPVSRGRLYHLLANPIYVGKVRHKDQVFDGLHDGIVDRAVFDQVQALLRSQAPRRAHGTSHQSTQLLTGLVFDESGDRLTPVHANKKGRRYCYYVSSRLVRRRKGSSGDGWRIPAPELEDLVIRSLVGALSDPRHAMDVIGSEASAVRIGEIVAQAKTCIDGFKASSQDARRTVLANIVRAVRISADTLIMELYRSGLIAWIGGLIDQPGTGTTGDDIMTIKSAIAIKRRGVETRLILKGSGHHQPRHDHALIDLVRRTHQALAALTDGSGQTISEVASNLEADRNEISRILPLAFLSPRITDAILNGTQPSALTAQHLARLSDLPLEWSDQEATLRF